MVSEKKSKCAFLGVSVILASSYAIVLFSGPDLFSAVSILGLSCLYLAVLAMGILVPRIAISSRRETAALLFVFDGMLLLGFLGSAVLIPTLNTIVPRVFYQSYVVKYLSVTGSCGLLGLYGRDIMLNCECDCRS